MIPPAGVDYGRCTVLCPRGAMTGEEVFVLHDGSLLGRGIESLLREAEGLRLVGAASTRGDARQEIAALNPDVIVIVGRLSDRNARAILDVMQGSPSSKVVSIGPGAERVLLHRSEPIAGNRPQDLIAAMLPGSPNRQADDWVNQGRDGNPRMGPGEIETQAGHENLCSGGCAGRETGGA